eukprot:CAMPEP_0115041968 /NCGR_PEP_ID=MMETSP0216-20121206/45988_1 /TAXON_ID=223996 /ORGANISM="Protocruzia adherens, Strain Boccale" /LENGTH=81 /DNA_ID=CAMNT_0002423997 /DNA_START=409 /DNA_END=651 /DNA_ORIENTATION=+
MPYVGDLITHEEAFRRSIWYDLEDCTYLFHLNDTFVVDAKRKGNKIRFANHSKKRANASAMIKFLNGDYHIGIYADRAIKK